MDRQTREIVDLFCATSDGTPQDLQRCIARGCPWDKPLPARSTQMMFGTTTPTIPINIAAQYKRHENLAILATKALEAGRPELLESPNLEGHSPAYLAVQNGSPQCLGVMAKAGANLHRACPHIYQRHSFSFSFSFSFIFCLGVGSMPHIRLVNWITILRLWHLKISQILFLNYSGYRVSASYHVFLVYERDTVSFSDMVFIYENSYYKP